MRKICKAGNNQRSETYAKDGVVTC